MQKAVQIFGEGTGALSEEQFVLFARDLVKNGPGESCRQQKSEQGKFCT